MKKYDKEIKVLQEMARHLSTVIALEAQTQFEFPQLIRVWMEVQTCIKGDIRAED